MTIMTKEQLARRLAHGCGCIDRGCSVLFETDPEVIKTMNLMLDIEPGDGVLIHTCQIHGDVHRNTAHVKGETVVQILDEDDMQGLEKRLHLMEHFEADHEGKSPNCQVPGHGAPAAPAAVIIDGKLAAIKDIPADMLMFVIHQLVAEKPELREKLREAYGD